VFLRTVIFAEVYGGRFAHARRGWRAARTGAIVRRPMEETSETPSVLPPRGTRLRLLIEAIYRLYEHSGFALAGSVAFSFVVSLFPFCIFLGALSGVFGGRDLAAQTIDQLFLVLPDPVARGLAPEVTQIMSRSRIDLLTVGGFLAIFFATGAIETLRAALNGAYRVRETRPYPLCLLLSMSFVIAGAVASLVSTWAVIVGPTLAARFEPIWMRRLFSMTVVGTMLRYMLAGTAIAGLLLALHVWLAAGKRTWRDVWPGLALSMLLWLALASLWSSYLETGSYSRFYAGLSQLLAALLFFHFTAIAVILGAELNRGLLELRLAEHAPWRSSPRPAPSTSQIPEAVGSGPPQPGGRA
jgi:membrane protein